ncbi:phosphatidate cytidylyltransferase [Lentimicrobium sp.]|uniref:phosphatidate cytidylyltransferase n=1 Tax=Lentimicrobium sp. TaxID=2034841 RepID=UPI002D0DC1B9|nr:phosphatidate cytidylyltransferase [Lentimicrobium sp.]HPJ62166.1 phosphatidate cytidylyltransferase [Lentimicrobium sp.]
MNNFIKRTITGAFFVIFIIGSVLLNPWVFASLFLLVSVAGMFEYFRVMARLDLYPARMTSLLVSVVVYAGVVSVLTGLLSPDYLKAGIVIVPLLLIVELFRNKGNPFRNVAAAMLGIVWIVFPLALLSGFFNPAADRGWIHGGALLGFFLILWIYDSGAYIVGSIAGKRKMLERISPGKSWEGFAGGTAAGLLTAYMISASFLEFSSLEWMLIAIVIIIFGTLGDLIESMLKRSAGIKDSGSLLPGHGGILDRFDAVLVAAPFVYLIITFLR